MKKETIEAGNTLLKNKELLQNRIESIVDGRTVHGATSVNKLDSIELITYSPGQSNRTTHFDFKTVGDNVGELCGYPYLSSEAKQAIAFQAAMFHEAISAILLKEEKRLQNEFDNLKD